MGIGYVDSVIVYNRYVRKTDEAEQYFGTRFDNVRVELTQGANIAKSGMENASVCVVKFPNTNLPKPIPIKTSFQNKKTTNRTAGVRRNAP